MIWLLDENEELKSVLTLVSGTHEEILNADNHLEFECIEHIEKYDRVIYKDEFLQWQEFIVQEVSELRDSVQVFAEHSIYELHNSFILDRVPSGTPTDHLKVILNDTRWSVGRVEGFTSKTKKYYRTTAYDCIRMMCDTFNAYINFNIVVEGNKITKRKINVLNDIGFNNGKRFTYSKDLEGVQRTILSGDIITALYGFGRGEEIGDGFGRRIDFGELNKPDSPTGQMYITDDEARKLYGRRQYDSDERLHNFTKVEFDDIEDKEELYIATKQKLQELKVPRINYLANVTLLDDEFENVQLGDYVTIIDNNFRGRDLRLKGKIFRIKRDLLNKGNTEIEIGNYIEDITDSDKRLNDFVNDFRNKAGIWDKSNAFDKEGVLDSSFIKNIIEGWNDEINGTSGFVYAEPGGGILTYDRAVDDNPTMVIQISGGSWRIANSKKSDGEWDFRTLGTGDGIYGDQIVAGSITTNQVNSDFGKDLDLESNTSINLKVTKIEESIEGIELTPGPPGKDGTAGPQGPKGDQGIPGQKGQDGKTTYTWIKYADTPTSGMSDLADNKKYMGIATNKDTATESTNYSDYTWANYKGPQGGQGIPGTPGADGKPNYTWYRYADTPTTGISTSPDGKKYIGLAFNKSTANASDTYSDYAWSLMPQHLTVGGRNYILNSDIEQTVFGFTLGYSLDKRVSDKNALSGKQVSVSFDAKHSDSSEPVIPHVYYRDYDGKNLGFSYENIQKTTTTEYQRFNITVDRDKIPETLDNYEGIYVRKNDNTNIMYVRNIKLELGDVATDWTPAPEDISDKLDNLEGDVGAIIETTTEMSARINLNSESIENEVERSTIQGDELVEQTKSLAEQLAESFTLIFEQMEKNENTEEGLDLLRTYFRFDINGAIVGKTGSPITLHTTNDGIEIRDNGIVIAYWKEGTMSVDYLITKISIVIGTHSIDKYFSPIFNDTTTTVRYTDET